MNTVVKTCISTYSVTDENGVNLGEFLFSRGRGAGGKTITQCVVKPVDQDSYETGHCYFADAKRDAVNGSLFA